MKLTKLLTTILMLCLLLSLFVGCNSIDNTPSQKYEPSGYDESNNQQFIQESKESKKSNSKVKIEVTNKRNIEQNASAGRYSARVEFDFKVINKSDKEIKGIQGTLVVKDLFNEKIISINCDFTGNTISPNRYITVNDLGIDINQFMDHHVKLYNENFSDLNFEYIVKTIIYSDGTSENFD